MKIWFELFGACDADTLPMLAVPCQITQSIAVENASKDQSEEQVESSPPSHIFELQSRSGAKKK